MTASVVEAVPRRVSGKYDRAFYSSMAIGMALTVLIGFGPTYYMKPFSHTPMTTLSGGPMTRGGPLRRASSVWCPEQYSG